MSQLQTKWGRGPQIFFFGYGFQCLLSSSIHNQFLLDVKNCVKAITALYIESPTSLCRHFGWMQDTREKDVKGWGQRTGGRRNIIWRGHISRCQCRLWRIGTLADIYYNTTTKTWKPLVQENVYLQIEIAHIGQNCLLSLLWKNCRDR